MPMLWKNIKISLAEIIEKKLDLDSQSNSIKKKNKSLKILIYFQKKKAHLESGCARWKSIVSQPTLIIIKKTTDIFKAIFHHSQAIHS